jgi:V8-like Glu-specific endopeptidase
MWQAGLTECKKIVEDTLSHPLKRVAYQISTEGGQSGSPIVI